MTSDSSINCEFAYHVLNVGPGMLLDFETGAVLLTLMIHPKASQLEQRRICFIELCAAFAAETERSSPDYARWLRSSRPEYFEVAPARFRKALRVGKTALQRRFLAALMARPFLGQAKVGASFMLPEGMRKLTPSSASEDVAAKHKISGKDNLLSRAWRPSLPILHFAVGLEHAMRQLGRIPQVEPDQDRFIEPMPFAWDFQDIELFRLAVGLSDKVLEIVQADKRIHVPNQELMRIRWHE